MPKHVLIVFGTRPEAIKFAPLIEALSARDEVSVTVCSTGQHRELLTGILRWFKIDVDYDLNIMGNGQSVGETFMKAFTGVSDILGQHDIDMVLVQGDTLTTLAGAQAAYLHGVRLAHIEAGLRTNNLYSPWPEEGNRRVVSALADLHFAPTEAAKENLVKENVSLDKIHVTGNTGVDSLLKVVDRLDAEPALRHTLESGYPFLQPDRRLILVTTHRRENFSEGIEALKAALQRLAHEFSGDVNIVIPVHKNPVVFTSLHRDLAEIENIYLIEPQDYVGFVFLMSRALLIITDSGGIQEEAPSLGVPTLVIRKDTERSEGLEGFGVSLIPPTTVDIYEAAARVLDSLLTDSRRRSNLNPYGDGQAAKRIAAVLLGDG